MRYLLIILFLSFSVNIFGQDIASKKNIDKLIDENTELDTFKVIQPEKNHNDINRRVTRILTRYHLKQFRLNDSLSAIIFDNFIESLDRNKMYFLKSDMERFKKYRDKFDDFLYSGSLDVPYEIFNTYKTRVNERIEFAIERVNKEFNFSLDENYVPDRKDEPWAETEAEVEDIWRKRLKNSTLTKLLAGDSLKKAQEDLTSRYQRFHKSILQYKSEDVFQLYMNAFTRALDPHTSYFSPITSDNFKINMSRSLEGIGAQLKMENDYTTVVKIIAGGPAQKSGELHPDDKIVAVAQGKDGEFVDVVGWRLDDVVQLIRGEKGSVVRLQILKADDGPAATPETITLVRDKIKLEDQSAKKEIFQIEEDGLTFKLGVIKIPAFYIDFEAKRKGEKDYKSTTRDVKRLLGELQKEGIDGLIIDLRNNGGGSLQEAIDMTGLFIDKGPVVQVKDIKKSIDVGKDQDPGFIYDGPLAVMINRYSASASEIFSGAIQDYERGVILGENTYGKGTVQNLLSLSRFFPDVDDKLGQIKLTVAKFYRVTGSSTQRKGVEPDITYPSPVEADEWGESSKQSALKWDKIQTTDFQKYNDSLSGFIPKLREKHQERVAKDMEFKTYADKMKERREDNDKNLLSLNYDEREAEKEKREKEEEQKDEERMQDSEMEVEEKGEVDTDSLKTDDPLLEESGHILADLILLSKK
jgi:carboxyl-terminal processing protease